MRANNGQIREAGRQGKGKYDEDRGTWDAGGGRGGGAQRITAKGVYGHVSPTSFSLSCRVLTFLLCPSATPRSNPKGGGEERNLLLVGKFSHCGIIGDIYVVGESV